MNEHFDQALVAKLWRQIVVLLIGSAWLAVASVDARRVSAANDMEARSKVVATVNGVPIFQADVDRTVVASGKRDHPRLRQSLKLRLIAWELLRQAAARSACGEVGTDAPQCLRSEVNIDVMQRFVRDAIRSRLVTDEHVMYRLDLDLQHLKVMFRQSLAIVRSGNDCRGLAPASATGLPDASAITTAQTASIFSIDGLCVDLIAGEHVLLGPNAMSQRLRPPLETLQDEIRRRLAMRRLDEAIRTLVDTLMLRADVKEW
ncbi:hypothetical protein [Burkholderia pyrrocinia]|uniref:Peptidylprolyl isomerase n=1 Tax=Burkholderia pyrrocinia TaxID=60550 RepID=A0ABZ3BTU3_BURPY